MATLEKFKSVFHDRDKVDELVENLGYSDLIPLLVKCKGLEKNEADEFNVKYRRSSSKERLIQAISLIVEKVALNAHTSNEKYVVYYLKNVYIYIYDWLCLQL